MIKNILFDLDGTLLPMDQDEFVKKFIDIFSIKLKNTNHNHSSIIKGLVTGIDTMVKKSDGSCTNKDLFWKAFTEVTSVVPIDIEPFFIEFYENDFSLVSEILNNNPIISECISCLKEKNYSLIIATSPVFPEIAIYNRMKWNNINPTDFTYITTFENSRFAKPNINYYTDLMETLKLDPKECIMVGNDIHEDGIIEELGVDCYLITDYIVNRYNKSYQTKWHGSFNDFYSLVKTSF